MHRGHGSGGSRRNPGGQEGGRREDFPAADQPWNSYERRRRQIHEDREEIENSLRRGEESGASAAEVEDLVADLEGLRRDIEALAVSMDTEWADTPRGGARQTYNTAGRLFYQDITDFIRRGKARA